MNSEDDFKIYMFGILMTFSFAFLFVLLTCFTCLTISYYSKPNNEHTDYIKSVITKEYNIRYEITSDTGVFGSIDYSKLDKNNKYMICHEKLTEKNYPPNIITNWKYEYKVKIHENEKWNTRLLFYSNNSDVLIKLYINDNLVEVKHIENNSKDEIIWTLS